MPSDAIDEPMVHVPASTKVIAPVLESTVHTAVVLLVYDFVPAPLSAVPTAVGLVTTSNAYGPPKLDSEYVRGDKFVVVKDSVSPRTSIEPSAFVPKIRK